MADMGGVSGEYDQNAVYVWVNKNIFLKVCFFLGPTHKKLTGIMGEGLFKKTIGLLFGWYNIWSKH